MPHYRTDGVTASTMFAIPPVPVVEHEMDLPRPRARLALATDRAYIEYRREVLQFLYGRQAQRAA